MSDAPLPTSTTGSASTTAPTPTTGPTPTTAPIRAFLLDDHEVVLRGLQDLLDAEPAIKVVGAASSAVEASRRIPPPRPHVAVLDARLPDGSGIEVCRDIRS